MAFSLMGSARSSTLMEVAMVPVERKLKEERSGFAGSKKSERATRRKSFDKPGRIELQRIP